MGQIIDSVGQSPECPKILRIGVFFDGTGNNLFNDARDITNIQPKSWDDIHGRSVAHESDLAKYNAGQPAAKKEDKRSNIAKLYTLYKNRSTAVGQRIQINRSIYKEGIGTNAGEENYITGLVSGSGGAKRINEAINEVLQMLDAHSEKQYERIIDVFGFSRGAAQARDFINTFYKKHPGQQFKFGFIGIYDTVGSFGMAGDNDNYKPKNPSEWSEHERWKNFWSTQQDREHFEPYNFNLHTDSAKRIVHMIAADEVRENFPLSDTARIGNKHAEWKYIGVHSDIGGGYGENFDNEGIDEDIIKELFLDKVRERKRIELETRNAQQQGYLVKTKVVSHGRINHIHLQIIKKRFILQDLAKVTLHLMHKEARAKGVPLEDLPTDDSYNIPKELEAYYQYSLQHKHDSTGFRHADEIKELWAHRSHVDTNDGAGLVENLANAPRLIEGRKVREVFPNKNHLAILPPSA